MIVSGLGILSLSHMPSIVLSNSRNALTDLVASCWILVSRTILFYNFFVVSLIYSHGLSCSNPSI